MYFAAAVALVGASLGQQPIIPATSTTPADQDYLYCNNRQIKLPIRYNQDKKTIAGERLYVARNGENTWYEEALLTPSMNRDFFIFTAKEDGIYWFTCQDEDLQGHRNPPDITKTSPDMKVIVDTVKPRIQFTQCKRDRDGKTITIEWIVDDKNPNENQNKVHFKTAGSTENAWQEVSLPPSSKSGVKFSSGTTEALIVRVTASDMAKNSSEATYEFSAASSPISTDLSPVSPASGAPLGPISPISPIGATSAPAAGAPFSPIAQTPPVVPAVTPASAPISPAAPVVTPVSAPLPPVVPPGLAVPQVPVASQGAIPPPGPLGPMAPPPGVQTPITPVVPSVQSPAPQFPVAVMPPPPSTGTPSTAQSTSGYGTVAGGIPQLTLPASTPSAPFVPASPTYPSSPSAPAASPLPTTPVGMGSGSALPLQPMTPYDPRSAISVTPAGTGSGGSQVPLPAWSGQPTASPTVEVTRANVINYLAFDVGYDVESRGPSGISRVDLWVTRDEGIHWQKWPSQNDGKGSTIRVNLNVPTNAQPEGAYGFRIVPVSGAGLSDKEPASGDSPELRVVVDITPPQLDLFEPISNSANPDTLVIQWKATDKNFTDDPITIEWSEKPTGPWQPVATGGDTVLATGTTSLRRLPNTGQYAWRVPVGLSPRVYLKVCARDAAGNVREVVTRDPILVDLVKPRAKLNGIVPPAASQPKP